MRTISLSQIMQLYTVGLHELNPDGTDVLDEFGRVTITYTNQDILSNARILTGFTFTARRGNIEELFRSEKSRQDPLRIEVDKHDFFPKSKIDGGWIGDRYPLCVDLPKDHFLKMGAKFVLRGESSLPMKHFNPDHWDSDESIKRFVLSPGSGLYQALCNPGEDGSCNYANTVTLDSNLPCFKRECRVDDLEVVQVQPGTFYEYIRQPCVDLSFYKNPKKVVTGYSPFIVKVGRRHTHSMCADPRSVSLCICPFLSFLSHILVFKLISITRRCFVSPQNFQAVAARSCCLKEVGLLVHISLVFFVLHHLVLFSLLFNLFRPGRNTTMVLSTTVKESPSQLMCNNVLHSVAQFAIHRQLMLITHLSISVQFTTIHILRKIPSFGRTPIVTSW